MTTRNYTPTYPSRYAPQTAGEPARAQRSLAPLVPPQVPPVRPASELYGRQALSVKAMIADSRVSGPCRITEFDRDGRPTKTRLLNPRSPYFGNRLTAEQREMVGRARGWVGGAFPAASQCGMQKGDLRDADVREDLYAKGIMEGWGTDSPAELARAAKVALYRRDA